MSKNPNAKETPATKYKPRKMQLATILSDLNSLRASDTQAARALVSARPPSDMNGERDEKDSAAKANADDGVNVDLLDDYRGDQDLERAFKLSQLHRTVKLAYVNPVDDRAEGVDKSKDSLAELQESRDSVRLATRSFSFDVPPSTQGGEAIIQEIQQERSGEVIDDGNDGDEEDDVEVAAWS